MHETPLLKIAVVGPESTGKSTMAKKLAERYQTVCVPEYARYYCQNLDNKYTLQDEVNMYYGQVALEESLIPLASNGLLIADTTIMTIKIWSDHLFGHTPEEVLNEIKLRKYDFYLLMDIDLPWEDDPLRDFPEQRPHFLEVWKKELSQLNANYSLISGQGEARLENGIAAVQSFLAGHLG
ncbi:AAA family ATPase [Sphingobacterium corticibacter]|uniref:NadR n=1 Tax=Sphingobacterium corticibacter TaxID=2171749 RepID=A0A2T8HHA9_9SPHI|nr:ATP-binding protein [Sphingobacterium corticibacter]PVH24827.1 NadR [Sphingobacterium corticibacter]